jgi:hypothetical protein
MLATEQVAAPPSPTAAAEAAAQRHTAQQHTQTFRPHMCLGDVAAYEARYREQQRLSGQRATSDSQVEDAAWLQALDAGAVPEPIWEAAALLGDKRAALLRCFTELCEAR